MYIASAKRKENIAEYLLYMWQIEDIIRAYEKYYSDSRRGGREAPRPLRREDHRR